MLDKLISDSPESAFERATLPAGTEEKLKAVDWSRREVLIGLVQDEEQLQRCLRNKFYYTYRQNISAENLPIYFVALYQGNTGIEFYGRVVTTQEVKRRELPGKAGWQDKVCYKFTVKEWVKLSEPIRPEMYGPNPIAYTNYFLLTHSETYSELHLHSAAKYRFFSELKRQAKETVIQEVDGTSGFELDDTRVLFSDNRIQVTRDKQQVVECTVAEFSSHPNVVFRRIQRYVELIKKQEMPDG